MRDILLCVGVKEKDQSIPSLQVNLANVIKNVLGDRQVIHEDNKCVHA